MKQIVVISGKGGTGKTSTTVFWTTMAKNAVFVDADVDAPNLGIALRYKTRETKPFIGRTVAHINQEECTDCGRCAELCRFDAIRFENGTFEVDPIACEGCTLCKLGCPESAIDMVSRVTGEWFSSDTQYGPFVSARLDVGEGNSGALVTQVRRVAEELGEAENRDLMLIDGPPGIGCQTIAAITGVDLAVIVTEPSKSGIHDLERIAAVCTRLGVPTVTIINKESLAPAVADTVRAAAERAGVPVIGSIPFFPELPRALASGRLLESPPTGVHSVMAVLWSHVRSHLETVYQNA